MSFVCDWQSYRLKLGQFHSQKKKKKKKKNRAVIKNYLCALSSGQFLSPNVTFPNCDDRAVIWTYFTNWDSFVRKNVAFSNCDDRAVIKSYLWAYAYACVCMFVIL